MHPLQVSPTALRRLPLQALTQPPAKKPLPLRPLSPLIWTSQATPPPDLCNRRESPLSPPSPTPLTFRRWDTCKSRLPRIPTSVSCAQPPAPTPKSGRQELPPSGTSALQTPHHLHAPRSPFWCMLSPSHTSKHGPPHWSRLALWPRPAHQPIVRQYVAVTLPLCKALLRPQPRPPTMCSLLQVDGGQAADLLQFAQGQFQL